MLCPLEHKLCHITLISASTNLSASTGPLMRKDGRRATFYENARAWLNNEAHSSLRDHKTACPKALAHHLSNLPFCRQVKAVDKLSFLEHTVPTPGQWLGSL